MEEGLSMASVGVCANPTVLHSVAPPPEMHTITSTPTSRSGTSSGRDSHRTEDRATPLLGFRRALIAGCAIWAAFFGADLIVVRSLPPAVLGHFAAGRL